MIKLVTNESVVASLQV